MYFLFLLFIALQPCAMYLFFFLRGYVIDNKPEMKRTFCVQKINLMPCPRRHPYLYPFQSPY